MGGWIRDIFLVRHDHVVTTAAMLAVSLILSVAVHEFGHLLSALCLGFRVARIVLGPLAISRTEGRWHFEYSRRWFSACVSALPDSDVAWRARMLTVVAAGPLASFCLFLFSAHRLVECGPYTSASELWSFLSQLNSLIFALGLIPNSRSASTRNDARLFLTLSHDHEESRQIRLYHAVTRLQSLGLRPQAYPPDLMHQLANTKGNPDLTLFGAHILYLWSIDRGDFAAADAWDKHAARLIEERPLRLSDAVLVESACFELLHRESPQMAAQKLSSANIAKVAPTLRRRAIAAQFVAQGSHSQGLCAITAARSSLSPDIPSHQFELALLDALESRAILLNSHTAKAQAAVTAA